jgi:hypothetical protein
MTTAQDYFGHAIALQFSITELRQEITVDVCQENPRLVCMAIAGLQARADELIDGMKAAMTADGRQRLREAGLDGTDSTGG